MKISKKQIADLKKRALSCISPTTGEVMCGMVCDPTNLIDLIEAVEKWEDFNEKALNMSKQEWKTAIYNSSFQNHDWEPSNEDLKKGSYQDKKC